MSNQMTVEEYVVVMKNELEEFQEHWQSHLKIHSAFYSAKLTEAEWRGKLDKFIELAPIRNKLSVFFSQG